MWAASNGRQKPACGVDLTPCCVHASSARSGGAERDRDRIGGFAAPLGPVRLPGASRAHRAARPSWRSGSGPMCSIGAPARACAARCGRCAERSAMRWWSMASGCGWARRGAVDRRARIRATRRSDPEAALELCRGELLEGLEDDWARWRVNATARACSSSWTSLRAKPSGRGDAREAVEWTRRQVERDPFDEESHRRLMRRLAAAGDRAGALLVIAVERAFAPRAGRWRPGAPRASWSSDCAASRRPAPGRPPVSGLLPLVGRERELRELEQHGGLRGGPGSVVVIRGEAGIGKTRLATELACGERQPGRLTAACAALDLGGSAPFSLWAELIRELLPALPAPAAEAGWPDDLAALAAELPAHFARAGPRRSRVAPDLCVRGCSRRPSRCSPSRPSAPRCCSSSTTSTARTGPSLELAGYAARRIAGLRVMMVMTRRELPRSVDGRPARARAPRAGRADVRVRARPLRAASGAALARKAARLSERDVKRVVERAEGNPLLVLETARALERGTEEVAPSLRGSVRATLGPLGGEARRLVEIAAIAARAIEPGETRALELEEAAEAALQTGLLARRGGASGFATRCCARPSTRRSPSRGGGRCTRLGRGRC